MTKSIGYTDESVTKVEVGFTINPGIRWGSLSAEMVPLFEEQVARLERGYTVETWLTLDAMERAMVIAVRRIDNATKSIQAEAEIKEANRKRK